MSSLSTSSSFETTATSVIARLILALAIAVLLGNGDAVRAVSHSFDFDTSPNSEPITPIPAPPPTDPLVANLGERLFEDTRLSRGNVRSCITCHDIRLNGAGGNKHLVGLDGKPLHYAPLTVFNAALSFRLSWEGHYRTLEEQAQASLLNPVIMGNPSLQAVVDRLRLDRSMVSQFEDAFGRGPDVRNLLKALATFERSLLTPGSRFDRWLAGDPDALSPQELNGYHLFKSLGCVACHQGVNIGGNLFERRGIFSPLTPTDATADVPALLRVPSLRNIAATPPYFHDGSAPTLPDAVRKMSRAQLNSSLTDEQVAAIVAFLRTLTGNYLGRQVGDTP
jgi:cytochrome c peroxidase